MANPKDITDQRFGKLTAVGRQPYLDKNKHSVWSCRCDCGRLVNITLDRLTCDNGATSCGCEKPKRKGKKGSQLEQLTKAKDFAYNERNHLVCALSKLFPAWLERHPESEEWDDEWRWIVYIQIPAGQMTWHIHDNDLVLFHHLDQRTTHSWDGHTTEQKYARLASLEPVWDKFAYAARVKTKEFCESLDH